jgi:peptide-methionine (S)-S-oxide reductase
MSQPTQTATLGGGCFWCLEAVFAMLDGVKSVVPGYAGGHTVSPGYEEVCSGLTGHAEVVRIAFDPAVVTFDGLLDVFFSVHNPTTVNRQGADVGTQYRSIILYHDEAQRQAAVRAVQRARAHWPAAVVTQIQALEAFYEAEPYHHRYFERNPDQAYCRAVIQPKVAKARREFANRRQAAT